MRQITRRELLTSATIVSAMAVCTGGLMLLADNAEGKFLLRPPGALDEKAFLASCIKCGQCVQVCPYRSIKLLDLQSGINTATPYIDAFERGCYLCDLFPCILCCPSGALDPKIQEIDQVHMGIAKTINPQRCINRSEVKVTTEDINRIVAHGNRTDLEKETNEKLQAQIGKDCTLCLEVCRVPNRDDAIKLMDGQPVIGEGCVGCGACVEVCPVQIFEVVANPTTKENI
ncbi:MAG: 4Fe-4S dicluster domain-containing protein [Burkholderiales bacterium]|nr:4Fe-4S dicluster domain-containing protein [Burkholderiales bacterium]